MSVSQHVFYEQGQPTSQEQDAWPDLKVPVAASLPRVAPGIYEARTVDVKSRTTFRRRCLVLYFDVYQGSFESGLILARLPMYFRLPVNGHRLWSTSKLARLFDLLDSRKIRMDRLPMNALRNKLWRVEVGDVTTSAEHNHNGQPRPLHERQRYSVVRAVLERLA